MMWMCRYRRLDGVSTRRLADRFLREHDSGRARPGWMRGWYRAADGQGGCVMIETTTADELRTLLEPYAELVHWEVDAVQETFYNQVFEELKHARGAGVVEQLDRGVAPPTAAGNGSGA